MEVLFNDFWSACDNGSGPELAATIAPIAPTSYLNRLEAIYKDTNASTVSKDIAYGLTKSAHTAIQFPNPEIDTWTEIYSAYWYACGEILSAERSTTRPDWGKVYQSWRDLANTVIKGYSSGALEAWTLPVLYIAGKHLRVFAIKADESAQATGQNGTFNSGGLQEDIAGGSKNEKLEDAARVINRMFTLCISDRYVAMNSVPLCKVQFQGSLLRYIESEHRSKSPENGGSTIRQISCSKRISRLSLMHSS